MYRKIYSEIEAANDRQGKYYEMKNAHFHSVYEIYYLVAGTRKFFIESDIYNISKGDLVLIDKDIMHKTTYSSDKVNERDYILFSEKYLSKVIEKFGKKEVEDCFKQRIFSIPIQRREYVENLIAQIINEYQNKDDFSETLIECYMTELLIFLIRFKRHININKQGIDVIDNIQILSSSDESIQKAAKFILDNFNKNVSLLDVSNYVNMSSTYFSKKFKEVTGFGFKEYLLNLRIKKACELLLETKLSITDVAYESGFNDSNYFVYIFKKSKVISPLQYRKNREYI